MSVCSCKKGFPVNRCYLAARFAFVFLLLTFHTRRHVGLFFCGYVAFSFVLKSASPSLYPLPFTRLFFMYHMTFPFTCFPLFPWFVLYVPVACPVHYYVRCTAVPSPPLPNTYESSSMPFSSGRHISPETPDLTNSAPSRIAMKKQTTTQSQDIIESHMHRRQV